MEDSLNKILITTLSADTIYKFEKPGFFSILWIKEGHGETSFKELTTPFKAKEFILIPPDSKFNIISFGSPIYHLAFSIEYLHVEAKFFATDVFKLFISHAIYCTLETSSTIFDRIQSIVNILIESIQDDETTFPVWYYLFNAILVTLIQSNQLELSIPDKNIKRIHDFFLLVYKNCLKEKRVSFYADQLNISSKRLNQILQTISQHNASYYIQENIILEAKRRLLASKLNINEISFELGYEDGAYFSRFFKKWTGVSPEKYRKQLKISLNKD